MFHLSPVPLVKPRLSWGRRASASSAGTTPNKRKRTVRFSRQRPKSIDSDYEINESLQKLLWYRKKDLAAIKRKVESTARREVMGRNKEHCCRGLESRISDYISPSQSRQHCYEKFARGLLALQKSQKRESATARAEALRQYCLIAGRSEQHQSCARMRAKQDAVAALKQHESLFLMDVSKQVMLATKRRSYKDDDVYPFPPTPPRAALCRSPSQQSATHTPRAA